MKLRSGKVLPSHSSIGPKELNDKLVTSLQNFKTLFSGNIQHAKELLKLISKCKSPDDRFIVREKVAQVYNENKLETSSLSAEAGNLMRLVVGNSVFYKDHSIIPDYHDIIVKRIKNFD